MKKFKEKGGFGKWSIGIDFDEGCIVVEFDHYPNCGTIKLFDIVGTDLERLAAMFQAANYESK